MAVRKRTPGISRIDQPEKRTHGFFVRLRREGTLRNAFFADLKYGGKKHALEAAQAHYQKLLKRYQPMTRRVWAQIERRKSSSGMVGVNKVVVKRTGRTRQYWQATWSPKPYVVKKRMFSVQRYGEKWAKYLAMQTRKRGLLSMED
jgi:hypothetical protein